VGNVPILVVSDLHALDGECVLVLEVVGLVHFVVLVALGCSHCVLTHGFEDDVHQFNIVGAHQEGRLVALQQGILLLRIFRQFTEELIK